jgi:phosphatidylglycerol---prolipoprotein diacylglyceryl transferase
MFLILRWATHGLKWLNRRGGVAGLFMVCYAAFRILVETVRQPDAGLADFPLGLTMGMLLSLPMALFGGWLIWRALRERPVVREVHEPA